MSSMQSQSDLNTISDEDGFDSSNQLNSPQGFSSNEQPGMDFLDLSYLLWFNVQDYSHNLNAS
ncbi:hypothetical protein ACSS6W_008027 [Trichoderma asperelloides]